jgi:hypothetical protein
MKWPHLASSDGSCQSFVAFTHNLEDLDLGDPQPSGRAMQLSRHEL